MVCAAANLNLNPQTDMDASSGFYVVCPNCVRIVVTTILNFVSIVATVTIRSIISTSSSSVTHSLQVS